MKPRLLCAQFYAQPRNGRSTCEPKQTYEWKTLRPEILEPRILDLRMPSPALPECLALPPYRTLTMPRAHFRQASRPAMRRAHLAAILDLGFDPAFLSASLWRFDRPTTAAYLA